MPTSGTLNVVCHGTIAFLVGDHGEIDLLMPCIEREWDHHYLAGTWTGDRLKSLEAGEQYELTGPKPGDGKQCFDENVYICIEGPLPALEAKEFRRVSLPPPKQIYSANYIPVSAAETFENPSDRRISGVKKLATLTVLSYDCDDLSAARLTAGAGHSFRWLPEIVSDGASQSVNLHVFAEPWTFRPLEGGKYFPKAPLPFNTLLKNVGGDHGLNMLPPDASSGALFADIDPGAPIPGLPETEKLALCNHSDMLHHGMMHNHDHPYNCGSIVVMLPCKKPPEPPVHRKGFAILQNMKPQVLTNPYVAVVYWGVQSVDRQVDAAVQQMLKLDFVKSALKEYGVNPPQYLESIANPAGSRTVIADTERVLTTPERSAIAGGLNDLILAGKVPDPRRDPNLLYLIVAAPGAKSETVGVRGSHNYFYLEVPGGSLEGARAPVHYAWALQNEIKGSGLTALNNLTWTLSHELLEACTDPEPPNGYVFEGAEICDIASGQHGTLDGIVVSGYFSYKDGEYKTPGVQSTATGA